MKTRLRQSLTVATGIVALALTGTAATFAGSPSTVSVDGSIVVGKYPYVAVGTASVAGETCSVTARGYIYSGPVSWGSPVADVESSTWSNCSGGTGFNMTITQNGIWDVDITGDTINGVTPLELTGISLTLKDTATGGALCSFTATGTGPSTFDNSTQAMSVNASNLTVAPSPACGGLINGPVSFTGSFEIENPATGQTFPVTITS